MMATRSGVQRGAMPASSARDDEEAGERARCVGRAGAAGCLGAEALEQSAESIRANDIARVAGGERVEPEWLARGNEIDPEHGQGAARSSGDQRDGRTGSRVAWRMGRGVDGPDERTARFDLAPRLRRGRWSQRA